MKNHIIIAVSCVFLSLFSCKSDDDSLAPLSQEMEDTLDGSDTIAKTTIVDPVFEQYLIDNNLDNELDGEVVTANLENVTSLILDNLDITDLTGLEDFPNLDNLWLQNTNLTVLDVSQNTLLKFLYFDNNDVSLIDVSMLPFLEKLSFKNNNIEVITIENNPNLQILNLQGNPVSVLDVSLNDDLFTLDTRDTSLNCVRVSQEQLSDIPINWVKDEDTVYLLECN